MKFDRVKLEWCDSEDNYAMNELHQSMSQL